MYRFSLLEIDYFSQYFCIICYRTITVIVRWNHWRITGASREPKVSERYFRSKAKAKVAGCAHSRRSSLAVRLLFGWIVSDRLVLGRNSTFFDVCSLHRAQNERAQLKKTKKLYYKKRKTQQIVR